MKALYDRRRACESPMKNDTRGLVLIKNNTLSRTILWCALHYQHYRHHSTPTIRLYTQRCIRTLPPQSTQTLPPPQDISLQGCLHINRTPNTATVPSQQTRAPKPGTSPVPMNSPLLGDHAGLSAQQPSPFIRRPPPRQRTLCTAPRAVVYSAALERHAIPCHDLRKPLC